MLATPLAADHVRFDLRYDRLSGAVAQLADADRSTVNQAIDLIKKGDSNLALIRLSGLNKANPNNSSLRILTAYALLRAGDLLGAFEESKKAHEAPNGDNGYKCWFLGKLALLNGDKATCQREVNHAKADKTLAKDVSALEKELKKN